MSYIYEILDEESHAYKIGISDNPQSRLDALQTGNPHKLKLVEQFGGAIRDERRLHEQFAKDRLLGEWFRYYVDGDEIVVQGDLGNIACLVVNGDKNNWKTKWKVIIP